MININKLKKIKSNFPVMIGKNALTKKDCKKLISEIKNTDNFDDLIQGGRNRINKGSKNFKNYLKKSKLSNKLFNQFYLFKSPKILNKSVPYKDFNHLKYLIHNYKIKSKINKRLSKDTITLYKN